MFLSNYRHLLSIRFRDSCAPFNSCTAPRIFSRFLTSILEKKHTDPANDTLLTVRMADKLLKQQKGDIFFSFMYIYRYLIALFFFLLML